MRRKASPRPPVYDGSASEGVELLALLALGAVGVVAALLAAQALDVWLVGLLTGR